MGSSGKGARRASCFLVAVLAVIVVLLLLLLDWYIAPEKPGERKDLVLAAAQVLGGTALLSGLYFTWRTLQTNREGQITERFTRAIDQLGATDGDGNKRLEVRLGGIYALERIARDSEEDHGPIVEVLTAYVREHAPWPPKGLSDEDGLPPQLAYGSEIPDHARSAVKKKLPSPEDPDIRAILAVLRRRSRYLGNGESEPLDLGRTNLRRAKLRGAHLEGAALWATSLVDVDLRGAHLEGANLAGSDLLIANLYGTHLEGANLHVANLEAANLRETHLEGADLSGAIMTGANYDDVHLEGADLSGAKMRYVGFFGRVHMSGADLSGTNVKAADLTKALGLTQAQIDQANGDQKTRLPAGLNPPAWWPEGTDDQPDGDE